MATSERWPPALPQSLPLGQQEDEDDNVIRTETESGPAKLRRRYTAVVRTIVVRRFILSEDRYDTLMDFYRNTLKGTGSFMWNEPLPGYGDVECRFVGKPTAKTVTQEPNVHREVKFTLEILP